MLSKSNSSVYVVVLNYNNFQDTDKCIKSLLHCSYPLLTIVIVDNASSDDSVYLLKKKYPSIEMIISSINGGYASGMNIGAKYSLEHGADFILLLNNDTVIEKTFFEPMLELASSDEKIGIISPKVGYLNDKEKIYCGGGEFSYLLCGGVARFQGKDFASNANKIREITNAEGCCMFIKCEVFETVGFMNENYFMYFEEVEFSRRVSAHYKIYFHNESILYHNVGAGKNWTDYSPLYYYYYTRNRFRFFKDFNFLIKAYVILFSLVNSLAKSVYLIKAYCSNDNKKKYISSMKSLWDGFYDGLMYMIFNLKNGMP
jgi:GT2 family glycosyltransferase